MVSVSLLCQNNQYDNFYPYSIVTTVVYLFIDAVRVSRVSCSIKQRNRRTPTRQQVSVHLNTLNDFEYDY